MAEENSNYKEKPKHQLAKSPKDSSSAMREINTTREEKRS